MSKPSDNDLISISAAANAIGLNKSTLSRQVANGTVRSHGGKVRLVEVVADRAARLDPARATRSATLRAADATRDAAAAPSLPTFSEVDPDTWFVFEGVVENIVATAVMAGAPMSIAYTIAQRTFRELATYAFHTFGFVPKDLGVVDWAEYADRAGEALDLAAWEAHWRSRDPIYGDGEWSAAIEAVRA